MSASFRDVCFAIWCLLPCFSFNAGENGIFVWDYNAQKQRPMMILCTLYKVCLHCELHLERILLSRIRANGRAGGRTDGRPARGDSPCAVRAWRMRAIPPFPRQKFPLDLNVTCVSIFIRGWVGSVSIFLPPCAHPCAWRACTCVACMRVRCVACRRPKASSSSRARRAR